MVLCQIRLKKPGRIPFRRGTEPCFLTWYPCVASRRYVDTIHRIGQVPEWAPGHLKILRGYKLRRVMNHWCKADRKQKKSTGGAPMNKTGSNACYLRCKITKGAIISKQNKTKKHELMVRSPWVSTPCILWSRCGKWAERLAKTTNHRARDLQSWAPN